MILAIILAICVSCSAPLPITGAVPTRMQSAEQQAPPAKAAGSSSGQDQSEAGSTQKPAAANPQAPPSSAPPSATSSSAPAQTPSDKKAAAGKPRRHKKTAKAVKASDCNKSASATPPDPAPGGSAAGTGTAPPTNCPPSITVIHNGGTSEPAIQLVGGASGAQAADQRLTTEQLVGTTEANLKRIAGRQLNSNQQEMLKQIHQFLDQSKAAIAAGNIERGHNLALKAHLLSDELAKP
jgi:hypothetical protein